MRRAKKRGPGPSSVLITPDSAGNVVGIDPHKRTLTATVVDPRGGILASEYFRVSGDGHRALEAWTLAFGPVARWGVEGASSWGRHTAMFLCGRGYDVRDVCANRTRGLTALASAGSPTCLILSGSRARRSRTRCCPRRSSAPDRTRPDEHHQLLALWHNRRRSILASRQHLLNEAEHLLCELPLELCDQLPDSKAVRPRLAALADRNRRRRYDTPTRLRLALLDGYASQIQALEDPGGGAPSWCARWCGRWRRSPGRAARSAAG